LTKPEAHDYTTEMMAFLTHMCTTPASYREISIAFNAKFGTNVSRSAILGKCNRMGLTPTKTTSKAGGRAHNRPKVRSDRRANAVQMNRKKPTFTFGSLTPKQSSPPPARQKDERLLRDEGDRGDALGRTKAVNVNEMFDASVETAKSFLELRRGECRWPASSDATMACGGTATIGSYCTKHAQIAFRTMPTRSRNNRVLAGGGLLDTRNDNDASLARHDDQGAEATLALPKFLDRDVPSIDPGEQSETAEDVDEG
jgi:hypothetical protein